MSVLHPFVTNLGILVGVILILAILRPATAAGQGALNNGGNHSDAISAAGQQDTWTFAVTAGDHVFLRASQTSGGTAFAPRIRVFDAAQNLVGRAAGADSSSASSARLDYIATATGTFTLVVDSNLAGGTGNYRVDFLRQPGATTLPSGETGGPLANESRAEGAIALGDLDAWTFEAALGDSVLVRLTQLSGGAAFIPRMKIFDAAGAVLGEASGASESRLQFAPKAAGTFTLVIDSATTEGAGNYRIHRLKLPGAITTPSSDTGAPLTSGGNHDGAISVGDADAWTFDAASGERVFLRAAQTSGGTAFAPRLRVYDAAGLLVSHAEGASDSSASEARLEFIPEAGGSFTVVIDSSLVEGTGNYRLFYLKTPGTFITPSGDDGRPLVTGNQDGSTTLGDLDVWTFEADQGNSITVRMQELTGTSFNPRLLVYGPTGQLLGSNSGASVAQMTIIAPDSGIFVVVADSGALGGTGTYELSASGLPEQGKQLRVALQRDAQQNKTFTVNWPSTLAGHVLQWTETVADPESWEDIGVVSDNGLNTRITIPVERGNRFFRLQPPAQ